MSVLLKNENIAVNYIAFFLALPIIIQTFPYLGWTFFSCIPGLILFIFLFFKKHSIPALLNDSTTSLISLIVITFLYGIILDVESVSIMVIKDLIRGCAFLMAIVLIIAIKKINPGSSEKIIEKFRIIILVTAIAGALCGLLKFFLIRLGYKIKLLENSLGEYPWGTSLVTDYNFYALTLLIAALIALRLWSQSFDKNRNLIYASILVVVLYAGFLSGSRRFLVGGIILPSILFLFIFLKESFSFKKFKINLSNFFLVLIISTSVMIIGFYLTDSECIYGKLGCSKVIGVSELEVRAQNLVKDPNIYLSPRLGRWLYTFEIIKPSEFLFGAGFSYRQEFGCKFLDCKTDDYPHAPVLSALLYAGLLGFIVATSFFVYALVTAYRILTCYRSYSDLSLGLIAAIIFVSISGDSLLSMPVFISMLLICGLVVRLK